MSHATFANRKSKTIIMKKLSFLLLSFCTILCMYGQKAHELQSPDGNLRIVINLSDKIQYDVMYRNDILLQQCALRLEVGNQQLGSNPKLTKVSRKSINESLTPVIPLKYSIVSNTYNQLLLKFKGDYSIEFRAFNDGVAYRFITDKKGIIDVNSETLQINFPENYLLHVQQPGGFKTAYEEEYRHIQSNEWKTSDPMILLPVLIDTQKEYKILISESDLTDYPALFF